MKTVDAESAGSDREADAAMAGAGAVVLPCPDLDATVAFFTQKLGFRTDLVFPADDPSVVQVSGHGLHLRLERSPDRSAVVLRLFLDDPAVAAGGVTELTAPNGTRVRLQAAHQAVELPSGQASFVLNRVGEQVNWQVGRAGMRYRDLIPGRQGGRFIASHIQIPQGGPVSDWVHFHRIHFQMIYCYRGWVRVVYEGQGEPFIMEAGDCVLQPPRIRHRVLESSPGLEVIEVSCPAEHETWTDHELALPTPAMEKTREFDGQRFVRHVASGAPWFPWRMGGFLARDTGIAEATGGLASVRVVHPDGGPSPSARHEADFLFLFVLRGAVKLSCEGHGSEPLSAGDSVVVPSGMLHGLEACSADLELLEVALPAGFRTLRAPE